MDGSLRDAQQEERDLQACRHRNFRSILGQFSWEGIEARHEQAALVGMSATGLASILDGMDLSDGVVREVEWILNLPKGWFDEEQDLA